VAAQSVLKAGMQAPSEQPTGYVSRPRLAFAIMALLTGALGSGQPDILCSAAEHTSPLSGMTQMYLVMSAFHSPP
jgi:hypothetical protein